MRAFVVRPIGPREDVDVDVVYIRSLEAAVDDPGGADRTAAGWAP